MIISGIYEGTNEKPYDFTTDDGQRRTGTTVKASIRETDERILPRYRCKEVRLSEGASIKAKVGEQITLSVDLVSGNLVLLKEVSK